MVVPKLTLVTTPDREPIVAMTGLLLSQIPPLIAFERVIDAPKQTAPGPEMGAGDAYTVIVFVA
jgi:hypothetical protein